MFATTFACIRRGDYVRLRPVTQTAHGALLAGSPGLRLEAFAVVSGPAPIPAPEGWLSSDELQAWAAERRARGCQVDLQA